MFDESQKFWNQSVEDPPLSEFNPNLKKIDFSFEIHNPVLWWCNGLGSQDMYEFEVTAVDVESGMTVDTATV